MSSDLKQRWRETRPTGPGVHLDSAACSRQSSAAIDAAATYARLEAEVGGYVAEGAMEFVFSKARESVATLTGMAAQDVIFTSGASHALDLLLGAWPDDERVIHCVPGEFGPNLDIMSAHDFEYQPLSVDGLGRVVVDDLTAQLKAGQVSLVHLTVVPSHRGIVQPLAEISQACREHEVPSVVDAAQGLGHVDCAVYADAIYSTSRKWLAGPRGVGVLAVRPDLAEELTPRLRPPRWLRNVSPLQQLEYGEANLAARFGFSMAVAEYMDAGPSRMRALLTETGRLTRRVLSGIDGWRVVEPEDSPTAITTLSPPEGVDLWHLRAELIERHGIVTTVAEPERAPLELTAPVLRVSPHIDVTDAEMEKFAEALSSFCAR